MVAASAKSTWRSSSSSRTPSSIALLSCSTSRSCSATAASTADMAARTGGSSLSAVSTISSYPYRGQESGRNVGDRLSHAHFSTPPPLALGAGYRGPPAVGVRRTHRVDAALVHPPLLPAHAL